jgi:hypothetical protein
LFEAIYAFIESTEVSIRTLIFLREAHVDSFVRISVQECIELLNLELTVSRYEQWAQGVVERLADKEVPSVGCRVSAATNVIAKFTRSPNWQLLSTKICPDYRKHEDVSAEEGSYDQREGRGLDVLIRGGVLRLQLILVQSDLPH